MSFGTPESNVAANASVSVDLLVVLVADEDSYVRGDGRREPRDASGATQEAGDR